MLSISNKTLQIIIANFAAAIDRMVIYSGTAPVVDTSYVYSAANYTSRALASYAFSSGAVAMVNPGVLSFATTPSAVNATATGVATWAAFYYQSSGVKCFIVSVGDQATGTAPLLLQTTNLVSGSSVNIIQLGVKLN